MDKADPKKQIGLPVDEWGTWWDEEPGTPSRVTLYQLNCMRDAFVKAALLAECIPPPYRAHQDGKHRTDCQRTPVNDPDRIQREQVTWF